MRELHNGFDQVTFEAAAEAVEVDAGLRRYMLGIYNKVGLGLGLAAATAAATAGIPALRDLLFTTVAHGAGAPRIGLTFLGALVAFAPLVLLLFAGSVVSKPTPARTGALYWSVATLMGASLGILCLLYTGVSIAITLVVSALGFAAMSLIGYTTKRSLTGAGSFLTMAVIGLVLSLAANIVLHSSAIAYVTGLVGVVAFAGLIACDSQRLKLAYHRLGGDEGSLAVATDLGALSLFINFVNLFQFLLMFASGDRR